MATAVQVNDLFCLIGPKRYFKTNGVLSYQFGYNDKKYSPSWKLRYFTCYVAGTFEEHCSPHNSTA